MLVDLLYVDSATTRYSDSFYYYNHDEIIGRSIELYGEYSEHEVELLQQLCRRGSVVYDVGANIGYHTVALADTGASVVGFEPNKQNFALLTKNVHTTHTQINTMLFNCAVGNENTQVYIPEIDVSNTGNFGGAAVTEGTANTHMIRLDDLDPKIPAPTVIKIDVEGSELGVVQGAVRTLEEHAPVVYYEAHESPDLPEIYDTLVDCGYRHFYWTMYMNYNENNFRENKNNIFGNSCIFGIVATAHDMKVSGLEPVQGRTDSHHRLIDEFNNSLQQKLAS